MFAPLAAAEANAVNAMRRWRSLDRPAGVDVSNGRSLNTNAICRAQVHNEDAKLMDLLSAIETIVDQCMDQHTSV